MVRSRSRLRLQQRRTGRHAPGRGDRRSRGGYNTGNLGVCLLGNLTNQGPTPAARSTLVTLLASLARVTQINPQVIVKLRRTDRRHPQPSRTTAPTCKRPPAPPLPRRPNGRRNRYHAHRLGERLREAVAIFKALEGGRVRIADPSPRMDRWALDSAGTSSWSATAGLRWACSARTTCSASSRPCPHSPGVEVAGCSAGASSGHSWCGPPRLPYGTSS